MGVSDIISPCERGNLGPRVVHKKNHGCPVFRRFWGQICIDISRRDSPCCTKKSAHAQHFCKTCEQTGYLLWPRREAAERQRGAVSKSHTRRGQQCRHTQAGGTNTAQQLPVRTHRLWGWRGSEKSGHDRLKWVITWSFPTSLVTILGVHDACPPKHPAGRSVTQKPSQESSSHRPTPSICRSEINTIIVTKMIWLEIMFIFHYMLFMLASDGYMIAFPKK